LIIILVAVCQFHLKLNILIVEMPQAGEIEVWIEREDGVHFDEYKVTTKDKTTECFIESVVGVRFSIKAKLAMGYETSGANMFCLRVGVDGQYAVCRHLGDVDGTGVVRRQTTTPGVPTGSNSINPFLFGNTQFTGSISSSIS
jgi:hypothetical protein